MALPVKPASANNIKPLATFIMVSLGWLYLILTSGNVWLYQVEPAVVGLVVAVLAGSAYLVWRGLIKKGPWPASGLDLALWIGAGAVFLSLAFSKVPRTGLERALWSIGYLLIFYMLLDAFKAGFDRMAAIDGLLFTSGVTIFIGLAEVYTWYYFNQGSNLGDFRMMSLFGHPNAFTAAINLCAPLAFTRLFSARTRTTRVLASFWVVSYVAIVFFTASRGGLLGMAAWAIGLSGLLLWEKKPWRRLERMDARRRRRVFTALVIGLVALAGGAVFVFYKMASHPSHGSDIFGGRTYLWNYAVKMWQTSPWFGVGPGRFGLEFLQYSNSTPQVFWPGYAHGLFPQALAETGAFGIATLVFLIVSSAYRLSQVFRYNPALRPWSSAVLAGLAGFAAHSIVDDFTTYSHTMIVILLLAAWLLSAREETKSRPKLPLALLLVPSIILAGVAGSGLWSAWPYDQAMQAAPRSGWQSAASLIEESERRDPWLAVYPAEAGLARAALFQETQDPQDLSMAIEHFEKSLSIEPAFHLWWADKALLDWQSGRRLEAVDELKRAMQSAVLEPSYPLNMGWLYESSGDSAQARTFYLQALALAPESGSHPFWQQNAFRRETLSLTQISASPGAPEWKKALEALDDGQTEPARSYLAKADASPESVLAKLTLKGLLAERDGDIGAALAAYKELLQTSAKPTLQYESGVTIMYAGLFGRGALEVNLVPGFLKVPPDVGQFEALHHLAALQDKTGSPEAAEQTRQIIQRLERGEVIFDRPLD